MNAAKFLPPKTTRVLERERLLSRLLSWEEKRLVIIHAQAGQGKSTLAAGYVQELSAPAVWYNLDQEDDNPVLFLSSLARAVQRAWPARMQQVPHLSAARFGMSGIQQALGGWIGQVFGNLPQRSLVVFDDYNNVPPASQLHLLIQALLDCAQRNIQFIIISRARPGLDIAKLRAAQSLGEITGEDLRFTDAEVQELFGIVFHMQISPHEAALVNATTEGWPAGLVLMHDYLASLDPKARSFALIDRRSAGFRTHVFDYLAQEVFANLPEAMQEFLLRTSVADCLPVPLVSILTGLPQSRASRKATVSSMVKDLRNRNLFVSAVDDEGEIIRYHALFREFLRRKLLTQTSPREVQELYKIAAAYFKKAGDVVRSVDLTLASGQFDRAIRQMESCGEELMARGQTQTLVRWIEALPLEHRNRPWFLFFRAVACRFTDPGTALTFYDLAFKGFRSNARAQRRTSGSILSLCGIIEQCFHTGGDYRRMGNAAGHAYTLLKQSGRETAAVRARLHLAIGMACFFIGRLQQGVESLSRALESFRNLKDHLYQITSALYLTPCALYRGDFRLARESVGKGFEAQASIPDDAGSRAALFLVKGMTALFEGNFNESQESIDQSLNLSDLNALESIGFLSMDIGGWLKIAQGDHKGAEVLLTECKRKGEESRNAFFSASAAHLLAISCLLQRKLDRAKKESDYALAIRTQSGSSLFHAIYLLADGAILLKLGEYTRAEKEVRTALHTLQRVEAAQQEANAHLVLAQLYLRQKKNPAAIKHLREGFSIGQARGFTYYALFDAEELFELAKAALAHGICGSYCGDLIHYLSTMRGLPQVQLNCLGGFRVLKSGTAVSDSQWKGSQAKLFVKLLVAQEDCRITRDEAMEVLWPHVSYEARRLNLNSLLHRIRKVLEPADQTGRYGSCIILKDDVIMLNSEYIRTDVVQFQAQLKVAERAKAVDRPERILKEYEKALALYQGDFLPDDLYVDGIGPARDRLRIRYLKALDDAADVAESSGDREQALRYYEKMFLADPCNEKACCWLMTRFISDGRRSEAVRTYERCERELSRELDLEPQEKTRKLYRSILGG
jgi:ATP/maltotriose-dependent transcriptional regulator MalT/DNA-binding SARP family transcriptional activator